MTILTEIELDAVAAGFPVGALPLGAVLIGTAMAADLVQQA